MAIFHIYLKLAKVIFKLTNYMSNVTNTIVLWQKLDLIRNIDKNTSETSDCVRRLRGMWNVKEYHVAERFTVCPEGRNKINHLAFKLVIPVVVVK